MTKKFLIGLVAAAAMVGCIKRTEIEPATSTLGSATISGRILVNTDETNDTINNHLTATNQPANYMMDFENLSGIQVIATWDVEDLDPNYNNGNAQRSATAETDANGNFSLTVETPSDGSDIYVSLTYEDRVWTAVTFNADSTGGGTEKITVQDDFAPDGNETTGVNVHTSENAVLADFEYVR